MNLEFILLKLLPNLPGANVYDLCEELDNSAPIQCIDVVLPV